jgi:hypothetical protein
MFLPIPSVGVTNSHTYEQTNKQTNKQTNLAVLMNCLRKTNQNEEKSP